MAVWSHISKSELVGAIRLDAEFWQPAYLSKEKTIRAGSHISLGALVSTFKKGIFYILAREYAAQGIPFYRSSNVGAILPKEDGLAFITPEKHNLEYKTALETGDLMMVKTGRSGASVVLDKQCNVSQDVIAVKVHRDRVNPYYLALYLNTSVGSSEMNRWFQGQVQPHLSLDDARRILVALLPEDVQEKCEAQVKESARLRTESTNAYQQAHELLESELGLDKLAFQKPVGYVTRFSALESSHRSDAEFFHTRYEPFLTTVMNYHRGWLPLKYLSTQRLPNFDGRKSSGDVSYIEIGDVSVGDGSYVANKIAVKDLPANAKIKLSGGEILVSLVRPTRGAIAVIDDELPHLTVCSGAFYVCTANEVSHREVIWLYLRCMKSVFEKYCGGTSYPTIDSRYISRFPVPLFDVELANDIQKLVLQSRNALRESEQLLEQAKTRVEQLIEEAIQS
jgi:hypothetical protein